MLQGNTFTGNMTTKLKSLIIFCKIIVTPQKSVEAAADSCIKTLKFIANLCHLK